MDGWMGGWIHWLYDCMIQRLDKLFLIIIDCLHAKLPPVGLNVLICNEKKKDYLFIPTCRFYAIWIG